MKNRIARLLGLLLLAGGVTGASAQQARPGAAAPVGGISQRILAEHNRARDHAGVPRLAWNDRLARDAQVWAQKLAREGDLQHASESENGGAGENLWMGSTGYYAPETMIAAFVDEGSQYQPGRFPDVSRTGNWEDVGHYTQIVWRNTREVGCAIAGNGSDDVLVCRYWPAGNWEGQNVY